jgi:hypothetical protein
MKAIVISVCMALLFVSCKQEKKQQAPAAPKGNKFFEVTLNVVAKKDDTFHVYYTEDESINFDEKNSVWVGLKGKDTPQDIVFKLPEEVVPTHLRVDFGINKDQEKILMNNFKVTYFGKTFEAKGADFFNYFVPNKICTEIDAPAATIIPVKKDKDYVGPMFYPQPMLTEELKKLMM